MGRLSGWSQHVKRRWLILCLALAGFPAAAHADVVTSFHSDISISQSNVVTVRETVVYDPQDSSHHGIYRFVPATFKDAGGNNYYTRVTFESVTDELGNAYAVADKHANHKELYLKIGDKDVTITGPHTYAISYRIAPLVVPANGYDRFIFNVTGNQWQTNILKADATIHYEGSGSFTETACYTGRAGATLHNCAVTNQGKTVNVVTTRPLAFWEGLTVDTHLPAGSVSAYLQPNKPLPFTAMEKLEIVVVGLSFLGVVAVLLWLFGRWFNDRQERKAQTIIPLYEPPDGLKPAQMSILESPRADAADIAATLIDLAVRGHLKITQTSPKRWWRNAEYQFDTLAGGDSLSSFETSLLGGMFTASSTSVTLSKLKKTRPTAMQTAVQEMRKRLGDDLTTKHYYLHSPTGSIVILRWLVIAAALGLQGVSVYQLIAGGSALWWSLGSLVAIVAVWLLARPRTDRTLEGNQAYAKVEGFKWFLQVTEKDRLNFTDAPEKTPELFSKMLPYAVALKVEKAWAKQFEGIDVSSAVGAWYGGYYVGSFNSSFASDFSSDFGGAVGSSFAGSSGSGSSGGGGGGGGGGGW